MAANFQALGDGLVKVAEQAHSFRLAQKTEEVGSVLSNLPVREYQLIGQYYLGWCAFRRGEATPAMFEEVVENSDAYRAKALWSLAALESSRCNYDRELEYLIESGKYIKTPSALVEQRRGIAVIKAKEGHHRQSLKDLEDLIPLLSHAEPHIYFATLNSLAVEMGEAGRLEEARNICKVVLASPYAPAYREWWETAEELVGASRSFVAMHSPVAANSPVAIDSSQSAAPNILFMPALERQGGAAPAELKQAHRPARVFNLQRWKKKMVKDPNGNEGNDKGEPCASEISDREMLLKIVELASTDDLPNEALSEMVEVLKKIVDAYKPKKN